MCNGYIDRLISEDVTKSSRFTPKEFKRVAGIQNNDKAIELDREGEKHLYSMNLLMFLPTYLKSMSDTFLRLQGDRKNG